MIDDIVQIGVRDGMSIGARVYRPDGTALIRRCLAPRPIASTTTACRRARNFCGARPARSNGMSSKATPMCTWTCAAAAAPTGRSNSSAATNRTISTTSSNGSARSLGRNGKVGGIGQSYFCMLQWFMGALAPPSLACLAAHDGLADAYRAGCYHGGIPCDFFPGYWWYQNRFINRFPASGPVARPGHRSDRHARRASDLRRLLARAQRVGDARSDQGAALFERRLGQDAAAHARQYRRLSTRRWAEKTAHVGRAQCLGGGGGILQRRIPQECAAAVLRSLFEGQEHGLSGAAECAIRRCAAPT